MAVPWKLVVKFSRPAEISSYFFARDVGRRAGCVGGLSTDSRDTPPGASRGATVRGRSRGIARDASVVEAPIVRIVDQARRVRDARARFRPSLEFLDQVREDVPDHDKDRRRVQIVHRHVRGDAPDLVDALLAPRGDASDDDAETFPGTRSRPAIRDEADAARVAAAAARVAADTYANATNAAHSEHSAHSASAPAADADAARAQRQADVVASSVDALRASLDDAAERLRVAENAAESARRDAADALAMRDDARLHAEHVARLNAQLRRTIEDHVGEIAALRDAVETARRDAADARARASRLASDASDAADAAATKLDAAREDMETLRRHRDRLETRAETHARELSDARTASENAERLAAAARTEARAAVAAKQRAEAAAVATTEAREAAAETAVKAERRCGELAARVGAAEAERDAHRADADQLRSVDDEREARVASFRADAERAAATRDAAIEASAALERSLASERDASRRAESRDAERIRALDAEAAEGRRKAAEAARFVAGIEATLARIEAEGPVRDALAKAKAENDELRNASNRDAEKMRRLADDAHAARGDAEEANRRLKDAECEANRHLKDAEAEMAKLRVDAESERERWRAAMEERDARATALEEQIKDLADEWREERTRALEAERRAALVEARAGGLAEVNAIARTLAIAGGSPGGARTPGAGSRTPGAGSRTPGAGSSPAEVGAGGQPSPRWLASAMDSPIVGSSGGDP